MFPYSELQKELHLDLNAFPELDVTKGGHPLTTVRAEMLRRSFLKKLSPTDEPTESARVAAKEKFLAINNAVGELGRTFALPAGLDERFHTIYDYFKDVFGRAIETEEFSLDQIGENLRVGPGAAVGADARNFFTKLFASTMTVTSEPLLARLRAMISNTETWAIAEMRRFKAFGVKIVPGNRIFFVNKTSEIARTCATEANGNMLVQQGVGKVLELILIRCFGINLARQADNNRRLAHQGSIDGSFGTIDLTSASDSIAWCLLKAVTPPRLLSWLALARSPVCEVDGETHELHMVSTMGNGFTFPLQTLLFASAVRAVYTYHGFPCRSSSSEFSVFGDDIVVRREAYDDVITFLRALGFLPNDSKSFNEGPFRESCGSDYYDGHLVRGVYIQTLESVQNRYSAINRLLRWSAISGIPLKRTISFILGQTSVKLYVPRTENDDAGLHVPEIFLAFAGRSPSRVHGLYSYRAFKPRARKMFEQDLREAVGREDIEDELLVASLAGHLQSADIVIVPGSDASTFTIKEPRRHLGVREMRHVWYRVARNSVSHWDPSQQVLLSGKGPCDPLRLLSTEAWITSVVRHLTT